MKTLIKNARVRRPISLGLLGLGAVIFLLVPGNAATGLTVAGLAVLIELLGITLKHTAE